MKFTSTLEAKNYLITVGVNAIKEKHPTVSCDNILTDKLYRILFAILLRTILKGLPIVAHLVENRPTVTYYRNACKILLANIKQMQNAKESNQTS